MYKLSTMDARRKVDLRAKGKRRGWNTKIGTSLLADFMKKLSRCTSLIPLNKIIQNDARDHWLRAQDVINQSDTFQMEFISCWIDI